MSRLGWTLGSWHRRVVPRAPVWLSVPRASTSSTSDSTVGQMRCAPDPLVRITGEADLAHASLLSPGGCQGLYLRCTGLSSAVLPPWA